jgi:hypothetical protein
MSTLIFQAAGTIAGGAIAGPAGALVGGALGAGLGSLVDTALIGRWGKARKVQGPRLATLPGIGSAEGAPIPSVYGRARVGGQVIWATRFVEDVSVQRTKSGGKGGGGQKTVTTTYSYYANIAVGLCRGRIALIRRIWADGRELDLTTLGLRLYRGTEDQQPDPLIVAKEGEANAPAYRGVAYVVFERFPLADFGNRVPQLSFEVLRPVGGLCEHLTAVTVIPGAGEFALNPGPVLRTAGSSWARENTHVLTHDSDWRASIDALQGLCPNLRNVSLLVSWFGDDLRLEACTVAPRVVSQQRSNSGGRWQVCGQQRWEARETSSVDGRSAYGGTPTDAGVVAAIRDLKARGLAVTLYPFLMMDVPPGNARPDPWTGANAQPAYPWRGRITCTPAPGQTGSPDATTAINAAVARFFGTALPGHFGTAGDAVVYTGPAEWSLRRQVLHYARLAAIAGGVDAFIIGSEFVGLTRLRSAPGTYPAAARFAQLAADVRGMLGPATKIVYAADWTEYGAHVPAPGEVRFPLDPLWSSSSIDAIGIDAWWPLTDWRDGPLHRDRALARDAADPDYLFARTAAGEAYDWYYGDDAARTAQERSAIGSGGADDWVFRQKDVAGWWSSTHVERVAGKPVRTTAWKPGQKPVWLTEFGCPAVDKGGNGPNAFPDPKSSEGRLPPFSSGGRDDLVQHRVLEATLKRFDPGFPGHVPQPTAPGAPDATAMVPAGRMYAWCWDARPFPSFPAQSDTWSDAGAWRTGHWLTGRLEGAPVDRLVAAMLADAGLTASFEGVDGFCDGYVVDRPMSLRAAIEPLADLYGFDLAVSADGLRFVGRSVTPIVDLAIGDLVPDDEGATVHLARAEESELPHALTVTYIDGEADFSSATASSRRLSGSGRREASLSLPAALPAEQAARLADIALHETWAGREAAEFTVRPGLLAIEPGDTVRLPEARGSGLFRVERITDGAARKIAARAVQPGLSEAAAGAGTLRRAASPALSGPAQVVVIDWPTADADPPLLQSLAVAADPWPGPVAVWRSVDGASFDLFTVAQSPSRIGRTLATLPAGPAWRFDDAAVLEVELDSGMLSASGDAGALDLSSSLAIRHASGLWEVVGFSRSELIGPRRWRLTRLVRGCGGREHLCAAEIPAGSTAVVIDGSVVPVGSGLSALGSAWIYRVGPADRSVGDPTMAGFTATPEPEALRPLAPVEVRATRGPDGITLAWTRRGRLHSDTWNLAEVPLDEASESYTVEILAGTVVKRVLAADRPSLLYAAGSEAADFGSPQETLVVRISQVSSLVGAGRPAMATLTIG